MSGSLPIWQIRVRTVSSEIGQEGRKRIREGSRIAIHEWYYSRRKSWMAREFEDLGGGVTATVLLRSELKDHRIERSTP